MEIGEWLDRAELEQSDNLHKFNFERERSYGCAHLEASHRSFATHLAPIDATTDQRTADAILEEFYAGQSNSPRPLDDTAADVRYLPPGLRMRSRQVFLKHLGIDSSYLRRIGFRDADIRKVEDGVDELLRRRPIDAALEVELQAVVAEVLARLAAPTAIPRAVRGSVPGHPVMAAPATTFGDEPWWFTFEAELEAEERSLPPRADALERSGYVAGVRSALGLHNVRDADTEADVAMGGAFRFRVLFQLATDIPDALSKPWRQPGMFSGGIPYLFVSNPRSGDGGRTVRLMSRACGTTHLSCNCGHDGLPEGVVPGYVVMAQAPSRNVRGIYLVLHRDLERYESPSCDDIRARRAA